MIVGNNIPVVGNGENFVLERLSGQTANVQRFAAGGFDGPAAFSTNPTKSGLVADTSNMQSVNYIIKY